MKGTDYKIESFTSAHYQKFSVSIRQLSWNLLTKWKGLHIVISKNEGNLSNDRCTVHFIKQYQVSYDACKITRDTLLWHIQDHGGGYEREKVKLDIGKEASDAKIQRKSATPKGWRQQEMKDFLTDYPRLRVRVIQSWTSAVPLHVKHHGFLSKDYTRVKTSRRRMITSTLLWCECETWLQLCSFHVMRKPLQGRATFWHAFAG